MDHNEESMQFTVGEGQIKAFRSSLLLLGKIGGNLMVLAERHQLTFSCCNSNRSAFISTSLGRQFFQAYDFLGTQPLRAVVSFRHVLPIIRASKVKRASFTLMNHANVFIASLECEQGMVKEFRIPFTDDQHFSPRVDREVPGVRFVSPDPSSIAKLLSTFHSASEMVSIKSTPTGQDQSKDNVIELRTHMMHDEVTHNSLHTSLECQSTMAFGAISNTRGVPTEVSFNIKDFNVLVNAAEAFECPLEVSFSTPGAPVYASCSPSYELQLELILVTLSDAGIQREYQPIMSHREPTVESTGHHNPFDMLTGMGIDANEGDIVVSSPTRSQEPSNMLPGYIA